MNSIRRRLLLELFEAGLDRVSGRLSVARALSASSGPVWIAAIGKAASAMALGAHDVLDGSIERTLLITKDGHVAPQIQTLRNVEIHESSHPVPDKRSLAAGQGLLKWLRELPRSVEPLFLVSGGASSLVEVLEDGVTFEQLGKLNAEGLASGIPIAELNERRSKLSRIKGGGVARLLGERPARALFISDVPGDDPAVIGSGLLGPARDYQDRIERIIVASLDHAVEGACAAAEKLGLDVRRPPSRFDDDAARLAVRFTHELHLNPAQVCVWGGESTVRLPANPGRGGRNQHLALAAARLLAGQPHMMLLAAGTDGTDGVTDDAGAIVDSETCARLALAEMDADDCMRRADSGTALAASGDLIHTGPTGTNVGDLVIGLKLSEAAAQIVVEGREGCDACVARAGPGGSALGQPRAHNVRVAGGDTHVL
ncbi:MAG: glycerate kinase [Steroidobacteraceae bacterium]